MFGINNMFERRVTFYDLVIWIRLPNFCELMLIDVDHQPYSSIVVRLERMMNIISLIAYSGNSTVEICQMSIT